MPDQRAIASARTTPAPARYYAILCEVLRGMGVDVPALLRAARIPAAEIVAPGGVLSARQIDALVTHANAVVGRDDLGFELGRRIKLSSHDILGYAMISSTTPDAAWRICARYSPLITPTFSVRCLRSERHAEYVFHPMMSMGAATLRFHIEAVAVATHEALVSMLGSELRAYDIHVSGLEPAHRRRYRALAPARIHFESDPLPSVRFVLESEQADHPLAMADRSAVAMAEARCAALLQRISQSGSVADWVAMMLRESRDGMPSLAELARVLHITPRTLDRRLQREGQRFLTLSNRVRHERACELLRRRGSTVTQAALELGYRDVANFSRAFRRAHGSSPSEFRTTNDPARHLRPAGARARRAH